MSPDSRATTINVKQGCDHLIKKVPEIKNIRQTNWLVEEDNEMKK